MHCIKEKITTDIIRPHRDYLSLPDNEHLSIYVISKIFVKIPAHFDNTDFKRFFNDDVLYL